MPEPKIEETTPEPKVDGEPIVEPTEPVEPVEPTNEEPKEDWKKLAEDERLKKEKAEKVLAGKRFNSKKEAKEVEIDEEDKPLSAKELRNILAEDRQENQKEFFIPTRLSPPEL